MLASTQAGGVGLNLQFCQDFLQLERQFNPSIEEQAEARFPRPRPEDPWPVGAKINGHYLIMAGTVDDFLTTLVEEKRRNVNQTLDGEAVIEWNQDSLLVELGRALQAKGLKKWRL
jgi:SNF2 family DNA or RNA helicase